MKKRRLSIWLILLVNMLILAHTVVPHHHHNKMFATIVNVLDKDAQYLLNHEHRPIHSHEEDDEHQDDASHHHHDSEDCLMNETEAAVVLKIQAEDKNVCAYSHLKKLDDDGFVMFAVIDFYKSSLFSNYKEKTVRRSPFIDCEYTDLVAHSKGLRSPPSC